MNLPRLKEPFMPTDISWRVGQAGKGQKGIWCKVLAYLDNRAIMDRLDEVCGPENWRNEYTVGPGGGVLCGISIRLEGEWVTKWDGAENTDIEAIKGGLSDAMKRAAVQWGIGRYLYNLGETWAEVSDDRKPDWHYANCKIKSNGKEEYVSFYWCPPRLPGWAVPSGAAAEPKPEPKTEEPPKTKGSSKPAAMSPKVKEEYEKVKALCLNCTKAELDEYAPRTVQTAPLPDKHRQFLTALLEVRRKQFELGDGQSYYMAAKGALLVTRLDLGVWGFVIDDALKSERIDADQSTALKASIQRRLEERQEGVAA